MAYPRQWLGVISLEVPPGLFADDEAPPGYVAALTAIAPATLRVRMIEMAGAASLAELMAREQAGEAHEVQAAGESFVWPGLALDLPGDPRRTHFLFESGGQCFHGVAEAPDDLWTDYGPFLEGAMLSIDKGGAPAPTWPLFDGGAVPVVSGRPPERDLVAELKERLGEQSGRAVDLILKGAFSEAEALIRKIDGDIYGAAALARAYETALERSPGDAGILERAIHWAHGAFPAAHTAYEADRYREAGEESEARLRAIFRAS